MIDPAFLASLRTVNYAQDLLVLVQLEQLVPNWWLTQAELADQLGTDRSTLRRCMGRLQRRGLIKFNSISNCGGTYLWWVKRTAEDMPDLSMAPAYVIQELRSGKQQRIPVNLKRQWADSHGIPYPTLQSFLNGYQRVLRERWKLIATPIDQFMPEVSA